MGLASLRTCPSANLPLHDFAVKSYPAVQQKGQLGHGDLIQRNVPTVVEALKSQNIIGGAAPSHTSDGLMVLPVFWKALQSAW